MSSHLKSRLGRVSVMLPAIIAVLSMFGAFAAAQDKPVPKVELFGGYSFFYPGADVHGILPGGLLPVSSRLESNPRGAGVSATYNFNRWLGLTLDASTDWGSGESGVGKRIDDAAFSNLSLGPKITFRHAHVSPFFEVLLGDHRLMPDAFHDIDKFGLMAGGGLDINLSRHVALRLIRADFIYSNYQYGSSTLNPATGLRGVRLQTGLNFMFGGEAPPPPPSAACSAEPSEVFAGEPVSGTATGSNFNSKRTMQYNWSGTGVRVAGTNASTQIDTTGLQPGSYQVNAKLSDGSKKGVASCMARFTVKQPHPPEIACSSNPGTIRTGGTSTIRSNANSPDNRRLTYSYSSSAGTVSGNDASATLSTSGARPGPITVTCTASDDRNPALMASAMTTVMVEAPPPPPPPPAPSPVIKELETRLALHSIYFQTARPTEKNPNSGILESQLGILTSLASDFNQYLTFKPDAHLILGGHADLRGSVEYNKDLTERRVNRAKAFLVEHGVPPGSIEVQSFGKEDNLNAEQVKQQMQENPDLSPDDRQKMLDNLQVIVLANNRRVDVSLSTTGQQSTRRYPFNAKDALALISTKGVAKEPVAKKKPAPKKQ
jgi:outer membrane protein OmpA-like peptidoglycan-associated protein/opacity protein-like surface antigen